MNKVQNIKIVFTDLDGTLLRKDQSISSKDIETLNLLGRNKILRVAATGRSLYSVRKVLTNEMPFDYVIFSSGAGVIDWRTQEIIFAKILDNKTVVEISEIFINHCLDFMIHKPIPENHKFVSFSSGRNNPDFIRRTNIYKNFILPKSQPSDFGSACQLLAVLPDNPFLFDRIQKQLNGVKVIRATSPLDNNSIWLEVFPEDVSKGHTADWLCKKENINPKYSVGIGNDYNDEDLLNFTQCSFVVENAPEELKKQYLTTSCYMTNGFSNAVYQVL